MRGKYFFVIAIFIGTRVSAQNLLKRTNNWYFGTFNGVGFSSGSPVVLNNGQMLAVEGSATISDLNGNLLFYTNGVNVWNKNHTVMPNSQSPNALWGDMSTAQGVVIIPKPCDTSIYYIFNQEGRSGNVCAHGCGFNYSIVDMTLQGGLGDISSSNNGLINYKCEEHCAAVHHANGQDIWVMTHDTANKFYSFLVTSAGVQPAVVTSIPPIANNIVSGYMKFSTDGNKVFLASPGYLFDFNKTNGVVSNPINLGVGNCYGVSFSPDNSRLYVCVNATSQIFQFNMLAGTPAQIVASKILITTMAGGSIYSLQQALDGKIYISHTSQGLDVINNPNTLGVGCNYMPNAVALTSTLLGVPNFVESFFDTSLTSSNSGPIANAGTDVTICQGNPATLNASGGGNYLWNTGQTTASIAVSPSSTSTYTVTVSSACGANSDSVKVNVQICSSTPTVTTTGNAICSGSCTTVIASTSGGTFPFTYSWNPSGQTTSAIVVCPSSTTTYSVSLTDANNLISSDTAIVAVNQLPTPAITGNTTICTGNSATLTASGGANYSWSTGATSSVVIVNPSSSASYTVAAINSNGCSATTVINITVSLSPTASVSGTSICSGQNATLTASGGVDYSWSNGNTTNPISVSPTSTSTYSVFVSIGNCSDTASATVTVNPNPVAVATGNETITQGQSTTLSASGGSTYSWNNGIDGSSITVTPLFTTVYCVMVTDANNCTDSSCVTVTVEPVDCSNVGELYLPNAFSPNGDGENDVLKLYYGNADCIQSFHLVIYSRWGEKVFETTNPIAEWDGSYKGKIEDPAVFVCYMKTTLITGKEIIKQGNISLIR